MAAASMKRAGNVSDMEARLSTLLHLEGRGYRSRYAEIAMDVDEETDLPFVEAALRVRGV